MEKETKHDFHGRFFATESWKENYKSVIYGEKGKEPHNHIGLKEDGTLAFHEERRKEIGITWESASITDVGFSLRL